jgi:hypothetical protein
MKWNGEKADIKTSLVYLILEQLQIYVNVETAVFFNSGLNPANQ